MVGKLPVAPARSTRVSTQRITRTLPEERRESAGGACGGFPSEKSPATDTRSPAVTSARGSTNYARDGLRELAPGVHLQDLGQQGIRRREIAPGEAPVDRVPCGVSS